MKQEIGEMLELLYPMQKAEKSRQCFVAERRRKLLLAGAAIAVLFIPLSLKSARADPKISGNQIVRPAKGKQEVELKVDGENYSSKITLFVGARVLSGQELEEMFSEAFENLEIKMKNENVSLSKVEKDLFLPEQLPDYGIEVYWESSDLSLVQTDGTVINQKLDSPQQIDLTATLVYGEVSRQQKYKICVYPYPYTEQELFEREIEDALSESEEQTKESDYLKLPSTISTGELLWKEPKKNNTGIFLFGGIIVLVLLYTKETASLRKQVQKREQQLLADYPDFLSRFLLLLGAGMNARGAWERMIDDYKKSGKKRFVYEEMKRTLAQLEVGLPELQAYEMFGRRCGLLPYMRFAAIVQQNLKKGARRIAELLQAEAQDAYSERKAQARQQGEEAGTKLLLPMGGMLVLVLIVILVPAFASFAL